MPIPISLGAAAPDFTALDQAGNKHQLKDYRGRWVVLYFYPKDDTSGCTAEACGIRDNYSTFKKNNVVVLGVSIDSVASHQKFAAKYKLPFTLLSDEDKKLVNLYGVWGEKNMMGRKYMGTKRTSLLIDPKGKIAKIYYSVKPADHAVQILNDLKVLQ